MNIPFQFKCAECGEIQPVKVLLHETTVDWQCSNCGGTNKVGFGSDFTVGRMLLIRSEWEHRVQQDFSMSIILSAAAVESELSRLYRKWSEIEDLLANRDPDGEAIAEYWRSKGRITERIEEVGFRMYDRGIDEFVGDHTNLRLAVNNNFPSLHIGKLAGDVQSTLFRPRNRILHAGYSKYCETDSARCFSIAAFMLQILNEMDLVKVRMVSG